MEKKTDSFFEGEGEKNPAETVKENQPAEPSAKKGHDEPPKHEETTDWKAKYEEEQEAKKNNEYLSELLRLDDSLDGESLDDVEGGERYRELRNMGLSAAAAYGALSAEMADSGKGVEKESEKSHLNTPSFRSTSPRTKMDRETKAICNDVFDDSVSTEERERLYRKVTQNNN